MVATGSHKVNVWRYRRQWQPGILLRRKSEGADRSHAVAHYGSGPARGP